MINKLDVATAAVVITFLGLAVSTAIYGTGVSQTPHLYILCIALWIVTYLLAYGASVHVYNITRHDKKFLALSLALLGLSLVLLFGLIAPEYPEGIKLGRYRDCVYRELEGRYCDEFPGDAENKTTLGAIGASVSSFMFIIGGVIAFGYDVHRIVRIRPITFIRLVDIVFVFVSSGFYIYVGVVSAGFHATHCYDWWRMDVGAVRAFPYVAAINVFSGTPVKDYRNEVKWHSLSLITPLLVFTFTKSPFWTETENTGTIAIPGVIFCTMALLRDMALRWWQKEELAPKFGPALIVALWLVAGGAILIAQGEPGACKARPIFQPVALAHLTFGMTPIALSFLRDQKVSYKATIIL